MYHIHLLEHHNHSLLRPKLVPPKYCKQKSAENHNDVDEDFTNLK